MHTPHRRRSSGSGLAVPFRFHRVLGFAMLSVALIMLYRSTVMLRAVPAMSHVRRPYDSFRGHAPPLQAFRQQFEAAPASVEPPVFAEGGLDGELPRPEDVDGDPPIALPNENEIHIVFSSGCNQADRFLQKTILQMTATSVGQQGPITEILAGCTENERARILQEPNFYHDFRTHFTDNYFPHPEPNITDFYPPYNKPYSLRHFLEHADPPITTTYIALVDADFAFFHKLEINTGRNVSAFYHGKRDLATVSDHVRDGWAIAGDWSSYGELYWYKEADKIKGMCGSGATALPCANVTWDDALEYYESTASPYILTLNDLRKMIDDYCFFTVQGRKLSTKWVIEMEAYSFAAANHGIRHTRLSNYAITHPNRNPAEHEYWDFVEQIEANPCVDDRRVVTPPTDADHPLFFFHYFHRYDKGPYHFYKRYLPKNLTDCAAPILMLPPSEIWTEVSAQRDPQQRVRDRSELWAHCTMVKLTNDAVLQLKKRYCPHGYNGYPGVPVTIPPSRTLPPARQRPRTP